MTIDLLLVGLLVAFGATIVLIPAFRRGARNGRLVDHPGLDRKRHARSVVSGAGMVIFFGAAAGGVFYFGMSNLVSDASLFPSLPVVLGALIVTLLGGLDDLYEVSYRLKFLVQFVVAGLLVWAGLQFDFSGLLGSGDAIAAVEVALSVLWIVGMVNAFNLIDGMDGLAAAIWLIAAVGMCAAFTLAGSPGAVIGLIIVGGAVAAFLVFNFPPASVFMGDAGSTLLGYSAAIYALGVLSGPVESHLLLVPLLALGLPLIDTLFAIIRRLAVRRSPFQPDRNHIHHLVLDRFAGSQRNALFVLASISVSLACCAIMISIAGTTTWVVILVAFNVAYALLMWRGSKASNIDAASPAETLVQIANNGAVNVNADSEVMSLRADLASHGEN